MLRLREKALFEAQTARLTLSKGRMISLKGEFGILQGDLAGQESGGRAFEGKETAIIKNMSSIKLIVVGKMFSWQDAVLSTCSTEIRVRRLLHSVESSASISPKRAGSHIGHPS